MNLSPHFTLAELTRSPTADAHHIANVPTEHQVSMLRRVCVELLEPVRAHFGGLVKINSGYRCLALNSAIGSMPSSQHVFGEAADFEVMEIPNGDVAAWCAGHLKFGQLILEAYHPGDPHSGWVHISLPTRGPKNGQVMTATPGSHGMIYSQGLKP